jgi:hypothetical protein
MAIVSIMGIIAVCSFLGGQASAQTVPVGFQDYTFVRDSTGETWLVLRISTGQYVRVGIPIFPSTDAEIGAVPANNQWIVPGDGARMSFERPSWAVLGQGVGQVATGLQSVAPAAPSIQPAPPPPTTAPVLPPTPVPLPTFTPLPLPTMTPIPPPTIAPIVNESQTKVEGRGDRDSDSFRLNGGNYTIRWDLDVPRNTTSCTFVGKLKNRDNGAIVSVFASDSFVTFGRIGEIRLTSVPSASRYVVDVDGNCEWEVWVIPTL